MTMICAMAVALGFAAWENVYYVINVDNVFRVALVRMCFCVPSHMSFGVWMGYFYGLHRLNVYKHKPVSAAITLCLALVVPIVLHGCYNLLVGINMVAVLAFNAVLLAISLRLVIKTGENDCALNPMSPTVIEWQYEDLQWSEQTNLT